MRDVYIYRLKADLSNGVRLLFNAGSIRMIQYHCRNLSLYDLRKNMYTIKSGTAGKEIKSAILLSNKDSFVDLYIHQMLINFFISLS